MSNEQIYLYRRKGLTDYATCDRARYVELSQHKLFETMICYASAESAERLGIDLELTRLARQGDQIEIDGLKALNDGLRAELGEVKGWYDEAMCQSNEAGYAGVSAAETIRLLAESLTAAEQRNAVFAEALEDLLKGSGASPGANKRYAKARAALKSIESGESE